MSKGKGFDYFVDRTDNCWLWNGQKDKDGYGRFKINRKVVRAHRFSYTREFGEIPEGLFVCHCCDTPNCVRPDHLFLGTAKDNNLDKIKKGRHRWGRIPGRTWSKTNQEEADMIREVFATKGYSQSKIAKYFNISQQLVSRIILNQIWIGT